MPVPSAHPAVGVLQVRQEVTLPALLPWRVNSTRVRERRKVFMLVMGVRNRLTLTLLS